MQDGANIPAAVSRVSQLMSAYSPQWALCGGWAVDAWLGSETRKHADVDVAVIEDDQAAIYDLFAEWELIGHDDGVADDSEDLWNGRRLSLPAHIHARAQDGFKLEFHLNELHRGAWVFSRRPRVALPWQSCVQRTTWGAPTVVPEVILYYKALPPGWRGSRPELRPHDRRDFSLLLPRLDEKQRAWLCGAISSIEPGHAWLADLA